MSSKRAAHDEEFGSVVQDIHGQFYDLLRIFDLNGLPSEDNPYLFNGWPQMPLSLSLPWLARGHCLSSVKPVDVQETSLTVAPSRWRSF